MCHNKRKIRDEYDFEKGSWKNKEVIGKGNSMKQKGKGERAEFDLDDTYDTSSKGMMKRSI